MKERQFVLEPFPHGRTMPDLNLRCTVGRRDDELFLSYLLSGPIGEIAVPAESGPPSRRDGLWKDTCFEFFLRKRGSKGYWEFNLSPSGNWNVYSFASYRRGMKQEAAFDSLPFVIRSAPEGLALSIKADLKRIISSGEVLRIAISAVVVDKRGGITFWALRHPGTKPDFHISEGFIAEA